MGFFKFHYKKNPHKRWLCSGSKAELVNSSAFFVLAAEHPFYEPIGEFI